MFYSKNDKTKSIFKTFKEMSHHLFKFDTCPEVLEILFNPEIEEQEYILNLEKMENLLELSILQVENKRRRIRLFLPKNVKTVLINYNLCTSFENGNDLDLNLLAVSSFSNMLPPTGIIITGTSDIEQLFKSLPEKCADVVLSDTDAVLAQTAFSTTWLKTLKQSNCKRIIFSPGFENYNLFWLFIRTIGSFKYGFLKKPNNIFFYDAAGKNFIFKQEPSEQLFPWEETVYSFRLSMLKTCQEIYSTQLLFWNDEVESKAKLDKFLFEISPHLSSSVLERFKKIHPFSATAFLLCLVLCDEKLLETLQKNYPKLFSEINNLCTTKNTNIYFLYTSIPLHLHHKFSSHS